MRQPPNEISGLRYFYVWMAVGFIARNKAKDLCCLIHTYDMVKDIVEQNKAITSVTREIAGLKEFFPQCFDNEGCFDIDKFREAIETKVDVVREGRSYDFLGKSYARMLSSLDTTTVLRPDIEHNSKPENANSENIYISGDNLDALQHLVKSYSGQVKCIYIDPPYNTGTDGFVYKDRFNFSADELEQKLSINHEEAEKIIAMTSGRRASHAAWLTFMMPRLLLAKDLLKKDGVIFISIDDNEQAYLKQLCDFIFGEDCFLSQVIVQSNKRGQTYKQLAKTHEYLLVYIKSDDAIINELKKELSGDIKKDAISEFSERELRNRNPKYGRFNRPNLFYPIYVNPNVIDNNGYCPISLERNLEYPIEVLPFNSAKEESCWRWGKKKLLKNIGDNTDHSNIVGRIKSTGEYGIFEKYRKGTYKAKTIWFEDVLTVDDDEDDDIWDETGVITEQGSTELRKLKMEDTFDFPKPTYLIKKVIELASEPDSICMDFFSGSGTLADSVNQLNAKGSNLKFIAVQLPEDLDRKLEMTSGSEKEKVRRVINFLESNGYPHTLDYVGIERIKRAAKKTKEENPQFAGDLGFKHYTIEEVPQNTLDKLETYDPNTILSTDDTLNMFGRETVITTWLLRDGYGLGAEAKDIMLGDYKATFCGHHLYLTDSGFSVDNMRELEALYMEDPSFNPDYIVLFGYSFSHNEKELLENNGSSIYSLRDKRPTIDIRY